MKFLMVWKWKFMRKGFQSCLGLVGQHQQHQQQQQHQHQQHRYPAMQAHQSPPTSPYNTLGGSNQAPTVTHMQGVTKTLSKASIETSNPPTTESPRNSTRRRKDSKLHSISVESIQSEKKETEEVANLKKEIERLQIANAELTQKLEKAQKKSGRSSSLPSSSSTDLIGKASLEFSSPEPGINIDVKRDVVEFHERLGGGGSGATVFRCTVKGFSFAAKVMDLTYAQAADIEPMMKEIAIMTGLQHTNIVRYIGSDCNMAKKEVRLFVELYSGTLRDVIESRAAQSRRITKKEIVDWSFQVAKGLNYLHTKNIIHRDLKSDNVFVKWDGLKNPKSMHIGDFDVSKLVEKGKVSFTQNIGTPGFIAPEIMSQGDGAKVQSYGFEADIWSFGMVLYELLTMKRPYHDVSPFQISESNAQGLRPALTPDVDENEYKELIKLFKQCTNKKATQRPTSKKLLSSLSRL